MGLDITAYSDMALTEPHPSSEDDPGWCWIDGHQQTFAYQGFEQSFRGLADPDEIFQKDFIGGRCYEPTAATETYRFSAGSYGGYNQWRDQLSLTMAGCTAKHIWMNRDDYRDAPFFELICFADNEGCIGPDAAKDLLADFRAGTDRWFTEVDPIARQRYGDWTRACELASRNGFIDFH
jgi:hypothetical protein